MSVKPVRTEPPDTARTAPTLSASFGAEHEEFEVVNVGLPSLASRASSAVRPVSSVDLSKVARCWLLIARGNSGKTMLARWLGNGLAQRNLLGQTFMGALDPGTRALPEFFSGVHQPDGRMPEEAWSFLLRAMKFIRTKQPTSILDFGGGDLALARLIESNPKFDRQMAEEGVGVVAAYVFTSSVDDIAILRTFEERGFQPQATVLVLNLGKAEGVSSFAPLRAQPAYKAALARGAVEVFMPKLEPASLASEIDRKRFHFFQAASGAVPEGSASAPIDGFDAMMVADWLERMQEAFAPVTSWLPWT